MTQKKLHENPINQIGFGFTAFMQTVALSVCFAAVTGQGLVVALISVVACAFFSLAVPNCICAPNPLFTVPFFFVCEGASVTGAFISLGVASLLYSVLHKKFSRVRSVPTPVIAGTALGLCIGATILLTNSYFGIGADGSTPFEMLKSYRSLGFHPHFMGLLTGTVTLFTMITYPFKFKKLSKLLPASFITVAIPYVLNLFLNPEAKHTAINEATFFTPLQETDFPLFFHVFTSDRFFTIIEGCIAFFILFIIINDTPQKKKLQRCSILSAFPTQPTLIKNYGFLSAIVVVVLALFTFTAFPSVFSRLSIHSAGAMLIVYAWQSIPYKKIAETFKSKENRAINIITFIICAVSFLVLDVYKVALICLILVNLSSPKGKEKKNDC